MKNNCSRWKVERKAWLIITLLLGSLLIPSPRATAETPEEKGLAIAQEAWNRDRGYGDQVADLVMILKNRNNDEMRRELRIKTLEGEDDAIRALVIFDTPKDVRGTALLTYSYKDKPDEQWLFIPSVNRVKRITGSGQSGPFMGSEFAFEDMGSQRVEKFSYKYLSEEELDGMPCHKLERYPENKESGYSKQVAWLDKEQLRVQKVDYYDKKGELLKTLTLSGYQQYLDHHWRPARMEMVNHQSGKSTILEWKNIQFKTGLTERDFDQNALKSAR
ncbi:MAG TPA: outer membrane lipoprotein-sorting protein [Candidatus Hydrogenedentes bacterium]|nr:outer membrane lipoprotein-sorting protein [Candidatus Hydrogenedentota bacterium]